MPEPRGMYGSMGCEHCSRRSQLLSQHFFSWSRVKKSCHGCAQAPPGDSAIRLQLAEREQALLLAQETIQVSPHSISPAKHCPRGGTEAGTASFCLPNRPATVVYMTARTGICLVPSTSWAAPVSVPRLWWHPQAWASLALALLWSSWPTSGSDTPLAAPGQGWASKRSGQTRLERQQCLSLAWRCGSVPAVVSCSRCFSGIYRVKALVKPQPADLPPG